jgi:hypothetical protein
MHGSFCGMRGCLCGHRIDEPELLLWVHCGEVASAADDQPGEAASV